MIKETRKINIEENFQQRPNFCCNHENTKKLTFCQFFYCPTFFRLLLQFVCKFFMDLYKFCRLSSSLYHNVFCKCLSHVIQNFIKIKNIFYSVLFSSSLCWDYLKLSAKSNMTTVRAKREAITGVGGKCQKKI